MPVSAASPDEVGGTLLAISCTPRGQNGVRLGNPIVPWGRWFMPFARLPSPSSLVFSAMASGRQAKTVAEV